MRLFLLLALAASLLPASARELKQPATLETSDLKSFDALSPRRQALITKALKIRNDHPWLKYKFGSADPSQGGFDCSGAIYYLLRQLNLSPPRTSSQQFDWVGEMSTLHRVPKSARRVTHNSFKHLQPGDLLFWSGTYQPTDGRTNKITHVGLYLGREKKYNHPVMISSSKGRSYRRQGQNGYGVFDFRLPRAQSKSRFVGYAAIPGIDE